jgi:hypothetical protein
VEEGKEPVLDLLREDPINTPFLEFEREVEGSIQDLERLEKDPHLPKSHSLRIKILLPKLRDRKKATAEVKEKEWLRQLIDFRAIPPNAKIIEPGKQGCSLY